MSNPRIKRHYSLVAHSADSVELRYGVWNPVSFTLNDESRKGRLHRLLSALDGSISVAGLAKQEMISREELEVLVDHLDQLGVLETGPSNALDYYLENMVGRGGRLPEAERRPMRIKIVGDAVLSKLLHRQISEDGAELSVEIVSAEDPGIRVLSDPDTSWLVDGLEFAEKLSAFEGWRDHFIVVIQQVIQPHQFSIINRVCLALGTPWLHASFDGPFIFVGPTIVPNRTACYQCFETRVGMNLRESASYLRYKAAVAEGRCRQGHLPADGVLGSMLCSHAAWEALNYATTRNAFTVGKVLSIYLPTMELSFNDVLRVSGCRDCGSSPERDDRELYFDLRTILKNQSTPDPVGT